ncbi:hypothetical protein AGABI2DRAFT_226007 [Agaricus bisporus var. bisporus H97]|uniref:hypothetical protein n=1 Tax=Agaricus bisporus var. bisporus (strain H97 / ATCC MYA-4626 / FGSC 10389) TaxID=936046 RepID=UPI00029F50EB|nr:hypothetical protein AGABI2DRAFT_226007 [Agaricus bisporus var. bisporus H97]EKV44662.1 hypothetical protein AGABI2DRAFT_226007 [Agaricus bisporus var. bisporus H97]
MHSDSRHSILAIGPLRTALLEWYATVHDSRSMPWRKPPEDYETIERRSQRAYEVWVSEVMLQQTQVITVIPYYNRWMERFPTLRELAKANVDEVNALWKGLGYYSRASRLLEGAKIAVRDYDGKLPDNAREMQAKIPGIGRYSAGAICSIAYGERVPVLDGNVHRLLSRFLALHSPPKAKATLDILWNAARIIVQEQDEEEDLPHPGDINQALIELGSTICKVRNPSCEVCPLRLRCLAYTLAPPSGNTPISDIEDACKVCEPMETEWTVTAFPMKIDRKKAREELDVINIVEWRRDITSDERLFLLIKRPMTGLLAGLLDFASSVDVSKDISEEKTKSTSLELLGKIFGQTFSEPLAPLHSEEGGCNKACEVKITKMSVLGNVSHIFSHIKKTYRVVWVLLTGDDKPPELSRDFTLIKPFGEIPKRKGQQNTGEGTMTASEHGVWVSFTEVKDATMGTGSMKVWNMAQTTWETTSKFFRNQKWFMLIHTLQ